MTELNLEHKIARMIIGPKNPLPENSKYTLDQLKETKWSISDRAEQYAALWAARTIIRELKLVD